MIEKILFVDDDASIIECYTDLFEMMGFEVVTASSGDKALEIYETHKEFRAVIIDIGLPHKTGTDIALIIRTKNPNQRIILTSGYTLDTLPEKELLVLKKFSDIQFITKPFSSDDLIAALQKPLCAIV